METLRKDTLPDADTGPEGPARSYPLVELLPNVRRHRRPSDQAPFDGLDGFEPTDNFDAVLALALEGGIELAGADFGNIQLLDRVTGALEIVAQAGFGPEFLEYFATVDDEHSACGRAAHRGAQTVIEDVRTDPDFRPHRAIAESSGFRAVQSTPLLDHTGTLVGMLSTHNRRPVSPPDRDLHALRVYGQLVGEALTQARQADTAGQAARDIPRILRSWPQLLEQLARTDNALADLTDHAVHRLFATSLQLADAQAAAEDPDVSKRIGLAMAELDEAIKQIQATAADALRA
jgi:GAF domain-containing protein